MKRKGVSMVMTIVAIGVITILAVSISAFTLSSYKNTVYKDKRDKLKLRAESGIDYGIYELKQFINSNPDVLSDPNSKDYDLLDSEYGMGKVVDKGTDDGIRLTVAISNNDDLSETEDTPSGRELPYIEIKSSAQYYSGENPPGGAVTADEWIDKVNIENDYFERIFHKASFTTASKHKGNPGCFSIDGKSSLTTSGSMFLQDNVNLEDVAVGNFKMNEGEIRVKSPDDTSDRGFTNTHLTPPSDEIGYYKDIDNCSSKYDNEFYYHGWKNKIMDTLPLCSITTPTTDEDQLDGGSDSIPTNNSNNSKIVNILDNGRPTNIYTYAVKENTGGNPIDFEMLVDGQIPPRTTNIGTRGIYGMIINSGGPTEVEDCIEHYGKYYKLILVDGDLDIKPDPTEDFNNYLIFCTGKVTFTGTSNFFNCSIFANKIEFNNAQVLFDGVLTNDSKTHISSIGSNVDTDFSANKGKIYTYLTQNLDKFGDYLNFKVLKFKEN